MEVDSWVSVQARREQFEQLYEDSPLTSPSKNTPFQPAPRPRLLSSPHKNSQNCVELSVSRGKSAQIIDREGKCRLSKHTPERSDLSNSERLSQNNIQGNEHVKSTGQRDEFSESSVAAKSSSANRTPVFKPANTAADGKNVEVERTVTPISSSLGKRGRLFSHIRSMSHGNFVIKRDSSVGRDASVDEQNGTKVQKENKCHRDWLTPKCKYRSDVPGTEDSKSSSSFEGKQRIVSNVVKNMKNKETPTVLRKLSFSSKNEKDFKNIKHKFVIPDSRRKKPGSLPSLSDGTVSTNLFNKQKSKSRDSVIDVSHKTVTKEKPMKAKSHASDIAIVPVLIAKAVAHVASKRCAAQSRDTASSPSSLSSEDRFSNPPARPPRRRAAGPDPVPRKKGKAPTPPSQCSTAVTEENNKNHSNNSFMSSSPDESHSIILYRYRDSPDDPKASAIVSSCHSAKKSSENVPDVHTSSTGTTQLNKFFEKNSLEIDGEQRQEHDNAERETFEMHTDFENIGNADQREETECNKNETLDENNTTEVEGLPAGPPPKKPPRTFAYDIYKNVSLPTLKPEDEESGEEGKTAGKTTQPIYAVPFKKNSKMIPKPPVRSKSDLSKEIMKPSVAPKPPHVLARAKRTSLVDPLSNSEKYEDAAIASEFQRQAHVRYSLRRPSKSRSSPSPRNAEEENSHIHSSSRLLNDSLGSQHDLDYSTVDYANDKWSGPLTSESVTQDGTKISTINRSPGLSEVKSPMAKTDWRSEYEDITPLASSVAAVSCHTLRGASSSAWDEQPLSLTYCFANTPSPDVTYPNTKRSMSDETLYKGCRQDEPVYATPTFKSNNHRGDQASQKELHYMCSILFTDEEEAAGGRDKSERRHKSSSRDAACTEAEGANKGKSSLILAWKREFRQSCRQVQSRIKKTVRADVLPSSRSLYNTGESPASVLRSLSWGRLWTVSILPRCRTSKGI